MSRLHLSVWFAASLSFAQSSSTQALKSLYDAGKWTELEEALSRTKGQELYRGAVAVTFHQDPRKAESYLRAVIEAAPKSEEAFQAYEWLSHLYFYSGQYSHLISTMEARWAAFPGRPGQDQEKAEIAGVRGLPDQVTVSVRPSTLTHEKRSIFIPLSVNGKPAAFFSILEPGRT